MTVPACLDFAAVSHIRPPGREAMRLIRTNQRFSTYGLDSPIHGLPRRTSGVQARRALASHGSRPVEVRTRFHDGVGSTYRRRTLRGAGNSARQRRNPGRPVCR